MPLGRLEPGFVAFWLVVTAACVVLGTAWLLRRRDRQRRKLLPIVALAAAVCPAVVCLACFSGGGAHPLVQYNDPAVMGAWTTWSIAWPVLLIAGLVGAVISLLLVLARGETWLGRTVWALAMGTNVLALYAVLQNFPSA